jgi:hypothetical protein
MKKGIEIPPAVIVVVLIVVVAMIGFIGRKAILPPQRVQMSPEAIKGTKEHSMGSGAGAHTPGPGGGEHSSP